MPIWLEADDVFFAQGIDVRWSYVLVSLVARQYVKGEDLDGISGLCHESSVQ